MATEKQNHSNIDLGRRNAMDADDEGSICLVKLRVGVCPEVGIFRLI